MRNPYPPIKTDWTDILRLCARYWFSNPAALGMVIALNVAMSVADILMPIASGVLVDRLVTAVAGQDASGFDGARMALYAFTGAGLAYYTLRLIKNHVWNTYAARNMGALLSGAFERVQRFSADWHANTFAGATVRKVTRGKWAYDMISNIIWMHFLSLFLVVTGLTIVMWVRFPLVGAMFFATVLVYIALSTVLALKYVRPANVRAAAADSAIGASIADTITNNPAVKAFGAEAREDARFAGVVQRWIDRARESWARGQILAFIQQALWAALQFAMVFVLIGMAQAGQATPGDVTFVITANFQLGGYLREVGDHIRQLQRASSEFADVVDFYNRPYQIEDAAEPAPFRPDAGRITLDRVDFAYTPAAPLYEQYSLDIAPGERIGLVGPSGSGKSTFVKLIQRLYDVDGGAIRIDGRDIREVAQSELRRQISLVPQDPSLFHRTLAENIAYSRPDASREEIIEAARRARAHDFIQRLPLGYETLVGERGVKLSGGERQRVAIARAFIADAPILIFDEATSSLDTITEKLIQSAMDALMEGRTTIIVAHRLSTVRDVDRILVFDHGTIVEQGDHAALIDRPDGRYRALYKLQAETGSIESAA